MQVTVFVDISSPWAYVGHLTLNEALRACADLPFDIDVECRPFQLETLDALPEGASVDRRELWLKHHGRPNGVSRLQGCVERAKYHGVAL